MPINRPIVSEIGNDIYMVDEFGLDCMFIVVGTKRALVVDTGMGYHDFRALVREITELPLIVACTHGSIDHTGGWDQFDEVYLSKVAWDRARKVKGFGERKKGDGRALRGMWGDPDVWGYTEDSVRLWERDEPPVIKELYDGLVFDLGGRKVTTVLTPGHSPGHCAFIDDASRILMSGDCCNTNIMCGYISEELNGLKNLKRHEAEFDRNYNGHIGYGSDITAISLPETTLDDAIEACKAILQGKEVRVQWKDFLLGTGRMHDAAINGAVRLNFNPERIWEPVENSVGQFPEILDADL